MRNSTYYRVRACLLGLKGLSADVTSGQFRANSSAVGRQWRTLTYRLQDQGKKRQKSSRLKVRPLTSRRLWCQSAFKFDPASASNFDPFERRGLAVALASSKLAGIAETWRARG